ncbi:homoaconitase [Paramyrothecium foliicola]|nr:homoaconitase [Paramyrothecium foliicola]
MASIPDNGSLTIANTTTEWGALSGRTSDKSNGNISSLPLAHRTLPVDDTLTSWYRTKTTTPAIDRPEPPSRDPDAIYATEYYIILPTLSLFVAGPNTPKVAQPLRSLEAQNIVITKVYLGGCTNSRSSDLGRCIPLAPQALMDGKPARIAEGVQAYISATSCVQQEAAEGSGDWKVLIDAGGRPEGVEEVYFGEAAVNLSQPRLSLRFTEDVLEKIIGEIDSLIATAEDTSEQLFSAATENETRVNILPAFPEKIEGEIVLFLGAASFESKIPQHPSQAHHHVVAGSFGNMFSGNSINNALMGLEVRRLIQCLRENYKDSVDKEPTCYPDGMVREQKVGELPSIVQENVACDSLEKWIKFKMLIC